MSSYISSRFSKKLALASGLSALLLAGCNYRDQSEEEVYNFTNFGDINASIENSSVSALVVGDMDGDGDLDIVRSTRASIYIYENKIPQKNK